MSVNLYQTRWRHIANDGIFHSHYAVNLKSRIAHIIILVNVNVLPYLMIYLHCTTLHDVIGTLIHIVRIRNFHLY
jgi:hypothetical protein